MAYPNEVVVQEIYTADMVNGDVYHRAVSSTTVANSGYLTLILKSNGAIGDLLRVRAGAGGLSQLLVTEAVSIENGASNLAWFNYNRNSAKTSVTSLITATSWSNGTQIFQDLFGTNGAGPNDVGGAGGVRFVLASSKHYAVTLQNLSGGAVSGFIGIDLVDRT